MRRLFSVLVTATVTAGLVAACGARASDDDGTGESVDYAADGTFTMALSYDLGVLDPYRNAQSFIVLGSLAYDPLVHVSPDGEIVSGLAERWEVDANAASFTLKSGITCSDGTPLTARQVADALDFVKDPENQSGLYGLLVPTTAFTVTADDAARTVHVEMEAPFGFLLETIGRLPIVCAEGMANPEMLKSSSAGTGPFVLSEVVPGDRYTYTKREDYTWGPDGAGTGEPGMPSKIVVRIVPNESTAANLLLAGEINMASIAGADRERLTAQSMPHFDVTGTLGELWFNQQDDRPGADLLVRQALTAALNLDELAAVSTSGYGKPATGIIGNEPKTCGDDTLSGRLPTYDPDEAAALLDQAGWTTDPDGGRSKDGEPLELDLHYTAADEGGADATELMVRQWEALGIQVTLTGDSQNVMNRTLFETSDFDAYWAGFSFNLPHQVIPYVTGEVPPTGQNVVGINNSAYQRLSTEATGTVGAAGCALWDEAEQALFQNLDVVPVSDTTLPYFLHKAEAQTEGWLQAPIPTSIRVLR